MGRARSARRERPSRSVAASPRRPAGPATSRSFLSRVLDLPARLALAATLLAGATAGWVGEVNAQTTVGHDWSLIPSGFGPGAQFRLLAVTSTTRDATSTSISDYNTFVQTAVASGHSAIQAYSSSFKVLGCTSSVNAKTNTGTTYTSSNKGVPIYWLDGNKVADNYADLYDGDWDSNSPKDEDGNAVANTVRVFNGCQNDGSSDAADPLGGGAVFTTVHVGIPTTKDKELDSGVDRERTTSNPFYALSPVFEVAPATAAPTVTSAEVTAAKPKELVLTFSEALATSSVPAATVFTVKVGGSAGPAVSSVAFDSTDATKLKLGLAVALDASQMSVTVDYAKPTSNPLKDADNIEVATFTGRSVANRAPACPRGQPADAWSACLTVVGSPGNKLGFTSIGGALSDTQFSVGGNTYEIDALYRIFLQEKLVLSFTGDPRPAASGWVLRVGNRDLALGDAAYASPGHDFQWDITGYGIDFEGGDKVSVSLRSVDTTDPITSTNRAPICTELSESEVRAGAYFSYRVPDSVCFDPDGDRLTWTGTMAGGEPMPEWLEIHGRHFHGWTELTGVPSMDAARQHLFLKVTAHDPDGLSASTTKRVYLRGDGAGRELGGAHAKDRRVTLQYSSLNSLRLDLSSVPDPGAFRVTANGSTRRVTEVQMGTRRVTLELTSPVRATDTVRVSYTVPNTRPLKDRKGNRLPGFTNQHVVTQYTLGVRALESQVEEDGFALFAITLSPVPGGYAGPIGVTVHWRREFCEQRGCASWYDIGDPRRVDWWNGGAAGGAQHLHHTIPRTVVRVPIMPDGVAEGPETFKWKIFDIHWDQEAAALTNLVVEPSEATVTIAASSETSALQRVGVGPPTRTALEYGGDGAVTLRWGPPVSGHGFEITGWQYRYGVFDPLDVAAEFGPWTDIEGATGQTRSHTVTGLEAGGSYGFQLRAMVGEAAGLESSTESVLLPPALPGLATRMTGSVVPPGTGDGASAQCAAEVSVRFVDEAGEAVPVGTLDASAFTVENGALGTPAKDADDLGWTVPAWSTASLDGLMYVRLGATPRWEGAEQAFEVETEGSCAPAARNTLASLALDGLTLAPAFKAGTTSYAATEAAERTTVTAAAVYGAAEVAIAPADADGEAEGHQVALGEGETAVTVTVTPSDGSEGRDYTVTVTRAADAGVLTGFVRVDASTDADLGAVTSGATMEVAADGTYGFRAETDPDETVGSVVLKLAGPGAEDEHTRTENGAPYSLYGDAAGGTNGGRAEAGQALAAGSYTLSATAYAERDGSGEVLGTRSVSFTVTQARAELTASFHDAPDAHGGAAFTLQVHFSENVPGLSFTTMRDDVFSVTAGAVTGVERIVKTGEEKNRRWYVTFEPDGTQDVSVALGATTDCAATGAICTADGRMFAGAALVVPGGQAPATGPLTGLVLVDASDQSVVATLAGGTAVDLGTDGGGSYGIEAKVASGTEVGSVVLSLSGAKSVSRTEGKAPYSLYGDTKDANGDRVLSGGTLPAGAYTLSATAHAESGGSGAVLGTRAVSFTVLGAPALSVADDSAEEGTDASLDFVVTLDRAAKETVTVAYATSDGTAVAGEDYTAASDMLTFQPGETTKTVSVTVLDDAHDEGKETMTLTLSGAEGAVIADGEAEGAITNSDPIPEAWLARFGRTVTGQVLDAVEARLAAPRAAGMEARLAGLALPPLGGGAANDTAGLAVRAEAEDLAALASMTRWLSQADADDSAREPETQALTGRDFLLGTSFTLTGGPDQGAGHASIWGHGALTSFDGREGDLAVDGEVASAFFGTDFASARWMAGLALGHSRGSGGYRKGGTCGEDTGDRCEGDVEATLTGLYPYAGIDLTERVSVWAAAGHGAGELRVTPEGRSALTADLSLSMGATGVRSEVLRPEGDAGLALAVKADTRFTRTSSDAVRSDAGHMEAAKADVWLVRAGIEGSRRFGFGGDEGLSVTPSFELGLRRDGGDAETGLGADLGGGLVLADPRYGLSFETRARGLVAHEADGFREWGANIGFGLDPRPSSDRGLSLTLTQAWGATPTGGMDALLGRVTLADLAANDDEDSDFEPSSRLEGEFGYGLPVFGGEFTGTPNVGFGLTEGARDYRIGWRLKTVRQDPVGFELSLDATRREAANDEYGPEHAVMLQTAVRW